MQSPKSADRDTALLQKWIEADRKAMALISLSVSDNQLQLVKKAKSAKKTWESS